MKTKLRSILAAAAMAMLFSTPVYADWYQNEAGTWYYRDDATGQNLTDFQYINGKWYFFSTREDESKGAMLTGEQIIVGMYFYLDPDDGGAVVFDRWIGDKYYSPAGYEIDPEIGNPYIYMGWSMDSRMEFDDQLLTKIPKVNPYKEPAASDNADCLRVVRENLDKSLWGKAFAISDAGIPEGKTIADRTLRELYDDMGFYSLKQPTWSHTDVNVMYKLAGRDIPYPNEWGENCQTAYDWLINFYKSYDWYNASEYDKAYHLYCYLAEHFKYGALNPSAGADTDFDGLSLLVRRLSSPTWVCEDFAYFYSLLGTSMGLNVGRAGGSNNGRLHVYNVVWIDGELWGADASGYSKYGKKDSYFDRFDDLFFRDMSGDPRYFVEGSELFRDLSEITYWSSLIDKENEGKVIIQSIS